MVPPMVSNVIYVGHVLVVNFRSRQKARFFDKKVFPAGSC
jgi:hypothetical protein